MEHRFTDKDEDRRELLSEVTKIMEVSRKAFDVPGENGQMSISFKFIRN